MISQTTLNNIFSETLITDKNIIKEVIKEIEAKPSKKAIKKNKKASELLRKLRWG